MPTAPPDQIQCPRGTLSRLREDDFAEFGEVVAANRDRLGGWISWGGDPELAAKRIGLVQSDWAEHRSYFYVYREASPGPVIGGFSFHRRVGPDGLEIGYWLDAAHTGMGHATEVAGVLTGVALALPEIVRVEIHTDEANRPSAAVPQRLGYRLDRVEEVERRTPAETGRMQIWVTP